MIIDSFTFFQELDLLEIRLNVMSPFVDKFVLVESEKTFQGDRKPLHYRDNRKRFEEFAHRIIHIVAALPDGNSYEDGWRREHASRNAIKLGLERFPDDAVLLLSDLDEIPDLRGWNSTDAPAVWSHRLYYYFVNMEIARIKGTVATTLEDFRRDPEILGNVQKLRDRRHEVSRVVEGGWHFSYLGGVEAIKTKIRAFAHAELLSHATDEKIGRALSEDWKRNVDLFDREIYQFKLVGDDCLPPYLKMNKDQFRHLWKPAYGLKELA